MRNPHHNFIIYQYVHYQIPAQLGEKILQHSRETWVRSNLFFEGSLSVLWMLSLALQIIRYDKKEGQKSDNQIYQLLIIINKLPLPFLHKITSLSGWVGGGGGWGWVGVEEYLQEAFIWRVTLPHCKQLSNVTLVLFDRFSLSQSYHPRITFFAARA